MPKGKERRSCKTLLEITLWTCIKDFKVLLSKREPPEPLESARDSLHLLCTPRMLELIPNLTDSSGQEVAEMYQDLWELELPEQRTRMMKPKRSSTALYNSLRLNLSLAFRPRTNDQSNSCFILFGCRLNIYILQWNKSWYIQQLVLMRFNVWFRIPKL